MLLAVTNVVKHIWAQETQDNGLHLIAKGVGACEESSPENKRCSHAMPMCYHEGVSVAATQYAEQWRGSSLWHQGGYQLGAGVLHGGRRQWSKVGTHA